MSYSSLLAALILFFVSLGFANGDSSFNFEAQMILENATVNSDFVVTSDFTELITTALQSVSNPPSPLSTVVQAVPPHLVIVLSMWYTGEPESVQRAISNINGTYTRWASGDTLAVSGALSHTCLTNIGQQPTFINYTNSCSSWDALLPPSSNQTCWRNLSLTFYTAVTSQSDPRASLQSSLCSFLPTDCGLITYGDLTRTQITISDSVVTVNVMPFTVMSENREATLATLVTYAQYASVLVEHKIVYILANGVQVFFQGDPQSLSINGTFEQCVKKMWYLVFLIVLVPLFLIVSSCLFQRGRASGKRHIKDSEREIRAGVRFSAAPWTNIGGGYQYGPPQGYGGGYDGVGGWQNAGALYASPQNAPQRLSEQGLQGGFEFWGGQHYDDQYFGSQQYDAQQRVPQESYENRNSQL
ncbi:conserved hypothetical protein [Leishmania major strain Friedlin]|uniref:Uncharacterized protein n=1 Tax=Leishmania major TaxID=5664 RepID=Q4QAX4_LEIMA|nr:conserved hypothetical protein [Leishmania major strain Friedlin]CAG9574473.1 hypothetical_protein_-_conserved [Leishmania major strain Friedlin]CAJ03911.1 conserved hypothetical protein [Leishmania major strain Friedlin]|eukprot:XP_001683524.1 conserved hypothetical protein [Leishmania major strain Friedlin]